MENTREHFGNCPDFYFRNGSTDEKVIDEILIREAYRKKKINFKIEPGDIWLDAGAQIGVFSLYAAERHAAEVFCYEPEPGNYELLTKNAALITSRFDTKVNCFNAAIAQSSSVEELTIAPNTWRHSLMSHYKKKLPVISVECFALDSVLSAYPEINSIKLDIEGSELEILQNDHNFENIKKLVFEYSLTKNRDIEFFLSAVARLEKWFDVDTQSSNDSLRRQKYKGVSGLWGGWVDTIVFCKKR